MNFLKKYSSLFVIITLAIVLFISIIVSYQESTTFDEKAHIVAGYSYVKYNDMRLNPEHPPLLKDIAGAPLLLMDIDFPDKNALWTDGVNEQWSLGDEFINSNNVDKVTFWSRFPLILIALLLGFFIFQWTKELAGTVAGLFALVLYSFDPNVLGHNHYVTTDIGIAAFIFISFYFFIKFLKKPSWRNTILAGIFLGLAQLTKFSAVLLFPFFALVILIYAMSRKKPGFVKTSNLRFRLENLWNYIGKYVLIAVICFAAIWILYYLNTFNMPSDKIDAVADWALTSKEIGEIAKTVIANVSGVAFFKPVGAYMLGVAMVFARVAGGNTYYFLGNVSNDASPLYFPLVFLIKETLPFLFLLLFTSLYAFFQIMANVLSRKGNIIKKVWEVLSDYLRTGVAQYSMFGFIALYSFLSITGNLNIGFRHLFPIMPFLYVLIAKKVFDFLKNIRSESTRKVFNIILVVFVIWIVLIPVVSFPSYLSYFNELVGGPKNGYKYVTDSNVDWGQDLKRLRDWVEENNVDKIRVDYFGGSSPEYYLGDKYISWHSNYEPESGWYAISINFLQGNIHEKRAAGEQDYKWTLDYTPIRVGDSIFVYYVK
ncbi:dolichyl-phosphate-mannose-protein mannosyltransferase [bacterium BMS3Abin15]|nr:dolichyl-phosphate-mannose-protein mannosyltransferase [bacterium BMS3Abin15]HDZ85865.1 phospholipid carrier-dependent glycosyltransferase [Candidatus Moranbacteria bacterium]